MTKTGNVNTWEKVYSEGKMLNKYPHDRLVSLTFRYFGNIKNKAKVKVLDLGCGAGNNLTFFASEGFDVTGLEYSKSAIEFCKERLSEFNLDAKLIQGTFSDALKGDVKYDLIVDRGSLYTLDFDNLNKTLSEISKNALTEEGIFVSFIYSKNHPMFKFFTPKEDGKTFECVNGFKLGDQGVFFDDKAIVETFEEHFSILEIYKHNFSNFINNTDKPDRGVDEYIVIGKRKNG